MSFDLKISKGDLSIDKSGSISLVSGNQKLRQDIIKILLTSYGDNKYHPSYGSGISQLDSSYKDFKLTEAEIKNTALSAINSLISMQRKQAKYQTLSPSEIIVSVLDIEVTRDYSDPRLFNLKIAVLTQQLTETFDNITIRLI
jgi:phage baseplate assembly protein W